LSYSFGFPLVLAFGLEFWFFLVSLGSSSASFFFGAYVFLGGLGDAVVSFFLAMGFFLDFGFFSAKSSSSFCWDYSTSSSSSLSTSFFLPIN